MQKHQESAKSTEKAIEGLKKKIDTVVGGPQKGLEASEIFCKVIEDT